MKTLIWTNDDRADLNKWLLTGLGQKFLRYLGEQVPDLPEIGSGDVTMMALAAAVSKGYAKVFDEIDKMRQIPTGPFAPIQRVEVEKD